MAIQHKHVTQHTVPAINPTFSPLRLFFLVFAFSLLTEGMYLPLLYAFGSPAAVVQGLLYFKYAAAGLLFGVFLLKWLTQGFQLRAFEVVGLFTLIYLVGSSIMHFFNAEFADPSTYTLFIFPLTLYFAGRAISLTPYSLKRLVRYLVFLYAAVFFYALLDIFILGPEFWRDVAQQERFLIDIKGYEGGIIYGLIGNFFFDPYGFMLRRAVGTQGDPLAFAYSAVLPLALLLFAGKAFIRRKWLRILLLLLGSLALLTSLTRAVILAFAAVLLVRSVFRRSFVAIAISVALLGVLFVASLGPSLIEYIGYVDGSTRGHVQSLAEIFETDLLDFLLGAKVLGHETPHVFESGFLNVLANYGLFAVMGLYFFIYRLLFTMILARSAYLLGFAVAGTVGTITSIVFSESFFSFTGFGLFWLLSGVVVQSFWLHHSKSLDFAGDR